MKKKTDKNNFFGLNSSEKVRIVREAVDKATKEQLDMVNRHGGVRILKNYSNCNQNSLNNRKLQLYSIDKERQSGAAGEQALISFKS